MGLLVTSSKTLYGGDMLVTTKIIQTMTDKMAYDVETFPDQKQREAIVYELLHGVVKTGSNLLDESQEMSWHDLSFEDQMRVATSLLTGLEDNAFLLAETIIREKSVVQRVKNILLCIRVIETRNIAPTEVFPKVDHEKWSVSDDVIELPRAALVENSEGGLVRIVFLAFDRLESILSPPAMEATQRLSLAIDNKSNSSTIGRNSVLNSKVISASLGKGRHIQLSQPVRLTLQHIKTKNLSQPICVFWSYIDRAWSKDGCHVESTNVTHTVCLCNHLTNFALLMDVVPTTTAEVNASMGRNVRIMIGISISLCIVFIVIALAICKLYNGQFLKVSETNQSTLSRQRTSTNAYPQSATQLIPVISTTPTPSSRLLSPIPNSSALATFTLLANFNNVHHHHHIHNHMHHHHPTPSSSSSLAERQTPPANNNLNVIRNNLESFNMQDFSV
ncbi:Latrophilin Cirl [Sergentomyia squamirostris]